MFGAQSVSSFDASKFERLLNLDVFSHDCLYIRFFRADANACRPMSGCDLSQCRVDL
jgi:hypothetical protein